MSSHGGGTNMAAPSIKQPEVKFTTQEQLERFMKFATEKNPHTERILKMLSERTPVQRRK